MPVQPLRVRPRLFRWTRINLGVVGQALLVACLILGEVHALHAEDVEGQVVLATTARTSTSFGRIEVRTANGSLVPITFIVEFGEVVNPMRYDTARRMIQLASAPGRQVRFTRLSCTHVPTTRCMAIDDTNVEFAGTPIPITLNGMAATLQTVSILNNQALFGHFDVTGMPSGSTRVFIVRQQLRGGPTPLSDNEFDRVLAILAQSWSGTTPALALSGVAAGLGADVMNYHHGSALYAYRP